MAGRIRGYVRNNCGVQPRYAAANYQPCGYDSLSLPSAGAGAFDFYSTLGVRSPAVRLDQLPAKLENCRVSTSGGRTEISFTLPKGRPRNVQVGYSTGNSFSFSNNKLSEYDYTSAYDNGAYRYKVTEENGQFRITISAASSVQKLSLRFSGKELLIDPALKPPAVDEPEPASPKKPASPPPIAPAPPRLKPVAKPPVTAPNPAVPVGPITAPPAAPPPKQVIKPPQPNSDSPATKQKNSDSPPTKTVPEKAPEPREKKSAAHTVTVGSKKVELTFDGLNPNGALFEEFICNIDTLRVLDIASEIDNPPESNAPGFDGFIADSDIAARMRWYEQQGKADRIDYLMLQLLRKELEKSGADGFHYRLTAPAAANTVNVPDTVSARFKVTRNHVPGKLDIEKGLPVKNTEWEVLFASRKILEQMEFDPAFAGQKPDGYISHYCVERFIKSFGTPPGDPVRLKAAIALRDFMAKYQIEGFSYDGSEK